MKRSSTPLKNLVLGFLLALPLAMLAPNTAQAFTVDPGTIGLPVQVTADGDVILQFRGGESAGFENELFLNSPTAVGPIFNTTITGVGTLFNLGAFNAGDILTFRIHVVDTGDNFINGPGAGNPDGLVHAAAGSCSSGLDCAQLNAALQALIGIPLDPGETFGMGFEDTFNGGDLDFNDLRFTATNLTVVPLPGALWLLGAGLAGLVGIRARKKKG